MSNHHHVVVTFEQDETPDFQFECTAPVGAYCRESYACFLTDQCDGESGTHIDGCDRTKVDAGECNDANWINAEPTQVGELGQGKYRIPVTTQWTGDLVIFEPKAAS